LPSNTGGNIFNQSQVNNQNNKMQNCSFPFSANTQNSQAQFNTVNPNGSIFNPAANNNTLPINQYNTGFNSNSLPSPYSPQFNNGLNTNPQTNQQFFAGNSNNPPYNISVFPPVVSNPAQISSINNAAVSLANNTLMSNNNSNIFNHIGNNPNSSMFGASAQLNHPFATAPSALFSP
jgi:hypothetical protein